MKRIVIILLNLIIPFLSNHMVLSQWLDPQTLQATVLIEKIQNNTFITHGTGIILYNYEKSNEFIVVTCEHLVEGKNEISVRVKPDTAFLKLLKETGKKQIIIENAVFIGNTVRFISKLGDKYSYSHPELDIAAFRLIIPPIFLITDTATKRIDVTRLLGIPKSGIESRKNLSLGDEIYFIGFPLGYGATEYVDPIVRSGSIAWMPKNEKLFLLDALSYGGNSGSPIFRKRILGSTKPGNISWSDTKLVGMVIGHQSITLENILNQPDPNELKFEKTNIDLNIGLATCVYADDIRYTIDKLLESIK